MRSRLESVLKPMSVIVSYSIWLLTDHLHISDFDSRIMFYMSYFPLMQTKNVPFHAKFNENIIYFS